MLVAELAGSEWDHQSSETSTTAAAEVRAPAISLHSSHNCVKDSVEWSAEVIREEVEAAVAEENENLGDTMDLVESREVAAFHHKQHVAWKRSVAEHAPGGPVGHPHP